MASERRRRRFPAVRSATPSSPLKLEDDDDDDWRRFGYMTTAPMPLTLLDTTPDFGMEFITIPGRHDRPLATLGPVIGAILCMLVMALTVLAVWRRRKRYRQGTLQSSDKVPLSATTTEGYCPYKVENEAVSSDAYALLEQPVGGRLAGAIHGRRSRQTGRARSLSGYDDPLSPPAVDSASVSAHPYPATMPTQTGRPRSCLVGLGDYDEPEFLIALGEAGGGAGGAKVSSGAHLSTVMVNEGARELTLGADAKPQTLLALAATSTLASTLTSVSSSVSASAPASASASASASTPASAPASASASAETHPRNVFYSCLNDEASPAPPDCRELRGPRGDVYYTSIGRPAPAPGTDKKADRSSGLRDPETPRPTYCALDRFGRKQGDPKRLSGQRARGAAARTSAEGEPVQYGPAAPAGAPSRARAESGPESEQKAPADGGALPGHATATTRITSTAPKVGGVYNTLQRYKRSPLSSAVRDSTDIYNVIVLD